MHSVVNKNTAKTIIISFFIFKCVIADVDLYEGNVCKLHDGTTAICKRMEQCQWLIKGIETKILTFSDIRGCGFIGKSHVVCCVDQRSPVSEATEDFTGNRQGEYIKVPNVISNEIATTLPLGAGIAKAEQACAKYNAMSPGLLQDNIVGGTEAAYGEFPHMTAIGYKSIDGIEFKCGGTLISESWVLTAAHCITTNDTPNLIRLGTLQLNGSNGLTPIDRTVAETIKHPKYSRGTKKHDIALIRMSVPVEVDGTNIRPACLRTILEDVQPDQELWYSGWGATTADKTSTGSDILLKTNVTSMPFSQCNETLVAESVKKHLLTLRNGIEMGQLCTVDISAQHDACLGDSGGPLQIYDFDSGLSTVVGVTSFGISCATALPAIATRVSFYIDWIAANTWP